MSTIDKSKKHSLYLWLDLEMTGLDVQKERIIEVGAIVTDLELNPLGEFHKIVRQPKELLDSMDEWNTKHHGNSGLLAKIPNGESEASVEKALTEWTKSHFKEPVILAGNSIGQDRLFIDKYFKEFSKILHYRMLDVTSLKLHFSTLGVEFSKKNTHRAIDDIKESIEEFRHFCSFIKV